MMSANPVVRRIAPLAFAASLCLGAAACGSSSNTGPNDTPAVTSHAATTPASTATPTTPAPTTAPTTPAPTTTAPKTGGAGF